MPPTLIKQSLKLYVATLLEHLDPLRLVLCLLVITSQENPCKIKEFLERIIGNFKSIVYSKAKVQCTQCNFKSIVYSTAKCSVIEITYVLYENQCILLLRALLTSFSYNSYKVLHIIGTFQRRVGGGFGRIPFWIIYFFKIIFRLADDT